MKIYQSESWQEHHSFIGCLMGISRWPWIGFWESNGGWHSTPRNIKSARLLLPHAWKVRCKEQLQEPRERIVGGGLLMGILTFNWRVTAVHSSLILHPHSALYKVGGRSSSLTQQKPKGKSVPKSACPRVAHPWWREGGERSKSALPQCGLPEPHGLAWCLHTLLTVLSHTEQWTIDHSCC